MDIRIQSVNFNAEPELIDFVNRKVEKLNQFFNGIVAAEVYLRAENVTGTENKFAEIRLLIPGNDVVAKKQSASFENSVDQVVEALSRQLKKRKEKVRGV